MTNIAQSHPPSLPSANKPNTKQIQYPLWFGGSASCMAVAISHPLDLIKVRMQMEPGERKGGTVGTSVRIIRQEELRGLYAGFSAGFMRQLTYGTIRLATYEKLKEHLKSTSATTPSTVALTVSASLSGFIGAIPGNASDIANIRMQNDASLPASQRRNYRHIFDAWGRMYKAEGTLFFMQGMLPNCIRCGLMTACQLASYDYFKGLFGRVTGWDGEGSSVLHFGSSVMAALVATSVCSPIDVVKTQLMGLGSWEGTSVGRVVLRMTRMEGVRWAFRGWVPSFVRLGPQTVATLVLLEQHKRVYRGLLGVVGG
ncbi:mitochondrial carrier domain-containing protein [Aspergillus aurantiobrunneus]